MTSEDVIQKTRQVLAEALRLDPSKISPDASSLNLAAWDSLRHLNVVLGLENEFEIEFSDAEMKNLTSIGQIVPIVCEHLGIENP